MIIHFKMKRIHKELVVFCVIDVQINWPFLSALHIPSTKRYYTTLHQLATVRCIVFHLYCELDSGPVF